jgi:DNA-binding transcriptional regulator YbjK
MAGFGFSVGDFINGINLIKTLIEALHESRGSSQEFLEVINELYSLERALLEVKTMQFSEKESVQHAAVLQAVALCRSSVDKFIAGICKYQPHLRTGGSSEYCFRHFAQGSMEAIQTG